MTIPGLAKIVSAAVLVGGSWSMVIAEAQDVLSGEIPNVAAYAPTTGQALLALLGGLAMLMGKLYVPSKGELHGGFQVLKSQHENLSNQLAAFSKRMEESIEASDRATDQFRQSVSRELGAITAHVVNLDKRQDRLSKRLAQLTGPHEDEDRA